MRFRVQRSETALYLRRPWSSTMGWLFACFWNLTFACVASPRALMLPLLGCVAALFAWLAWRSQRAAVLRIEKGVLRVLPVVRGAQPLELLVTDVEDVVVEDEQKEERPSRLLYVRTVSGAKLPLQLPLDTFSISTNTGLVVYDGRASRADVEALRAELLERLDAARREVSGYRRGQVLEDATEIAETIEPEPLRRSSTLS